ncbi:MAG: hypothetical protein DRZ90_00050 [Spirochaetes bacterium]|nr:MAG: hypothetical protein DRP60_15815 [Spirochaetota bacterium]RKX99142.1 MAG: hypothetical protein DRZ90_00050 [Spirochaetota bacterium]
MNNKNSPDWWSDRRFWNDFAPLMFDSERWGNAVGDVEGMIKLTGSVPPEKILDVGCGPGRHSLELGKKGFRATGIDINENYLETAEKLSRSGQLEIPPVFLNCDMRGINTTESFNGAISFFQSLGYFENPDEDLKVCTEVYKALEKDGWFLVEMDGKETTAASFEERTWLERDGRTILLEYEAEAAWSMLHNRWQFRDTDGSWHEYEFSYRLYSAVELGELLEKAGFASIEFFGALDGRPYNQNAKRLVALARR